MDQRCAACGYTSSTSSFFRSEKNDAFGRRKTFCYGCAPYPRTGADYASTARLVATLLCLPPGLFIFALLPKTLPLGAELGALPLGMGLAGAGAMSGIRPLTVAVHEFGHWCAARLVGYRVVRVAVGTGPAIAARRFAGSLWELRRFLFSGGQTLTYSVADTPQKWRHAVMLSGGVAANALAFALLVGLLVWHIRQGLPRSPTVIALLSGAAISQFSTFALSLWPQRITGQGNVTGTDGQQLLNLYKLRGFSAAAKHWRFFDENRQLIKKGHYDEVVQRTETLRSEQQGDAAFFSQLVHALQRSQGARTAFDYFLAHVSDLDGKQTEQMAWVNANAAWHAALTGDASLLDQADDLSERAFEVYPAVAEIKGTRGAYLACRAQWERGLPMLLDGVRRVEDKIDRADFSAFLARCYEGLGNSEFAAECTKLAVHFRDCEKRDVAAANAT